MTIKHFSFFCKSLGKEKIEPVRKYPCRTGLPLGKTQMNKNSQDQNEYQAQIFSNRLAKKYKTLRKWARKERVTCYRLYDRDIPEIPLAVDLYEFIPHDIEDKFECAKFMHAEDVKISENDAATLKEKSLRQYIHLYLYERPYEKDEDAEYVWLSAMADAAAKTTGIPRNHVITKLRKKQKGENQYEKIESKNVIEGTVQEGGQLFKVNLSDYLDTGLFLDHRPLRSVVRKNVAGKDVLNLFCYTGSFSVYSAEGKPKTVTSVDLSNTYISWAKHNFALNDFNPDDSKFIFHKGDVGGFLNQCLAEVPSETRPNRFDVIILDPPTFSNSKSTENTLDINRDWSELVTKCMKLLKPSGTLYFSTNSKRLIFDSAKLPEQIEGKSFEITDMTEESIPEDFKNQKPHRLWKIQIEK